MFAEPRSFDASESIAVPGSSLSASQHAAIERLLPDALHAWRDARDRQGEVQQAIYHALLPHGCGLLAPVFDGLLTACEACLRRRLTPGRDEQWIEGLLDGGGSLAVGNVDAARWLYCAVCSARIMVAAETGRRPAAPLA